MVLGVSIHHFIASGLSAVVFILLLKALGPKLPAGAQRLIAAI